MVSPWSEIARMFFASKYDSAFIARDFDEGRTD